MAKQIEAFLSNVGDKLGVKGSYCFYGKADSK